MAALLYSWAFMSSFTSAAPTELSSPAVAKPASRRLISLDVFRGLAVSGMILVDNPGNDDLAYGPIKHTVWNGWTPADFIFPSFMFLVAHPGCCRSRFDCIATRREVRSCATPDSER